MYLDHFATYKKERKKKKLKQIQNFSTEPLQQPLTSLDAPLC